MTHDESLVGRGLLAHPSQGVAVLRAVRVEGVVVDFVHEVANRSAVRSAGRELVGTSLLADDAGDTAADVLPWLVSVLASGAYGIRRKVSDLPGAAFMRGSAFEMFAQVVDEDRVLLQVRDVTEETQLRHALQHEALHDALTGLPNRRWFNARLRRALSRLELGRLEGQPGTLAILFVDVDDFKLVNDTLGHVAGDDLLRQVAERASAALRPLDDIARFGGDELLVLCPDLSEPADATEIAARVHTACCGEYQLGQDTIHATVCVGVGTTDHEVPTEQLISEADAALYEAKRLGRNRVHLYDRRLGEIAENRLRVHDELMRALEEDQLELHYQPQYELATGRLDAAEALLRWRHPSGGLQEPDRFLGIAEVTGLMTRIGPWVLQTACAEAQLWSGPGAPDINVNLSTRELMHPEIVAVLAAALSSSGLDPGRLAIEITESHAAEEPERLAHVLREIRALGATIELDDFGTGYSSLLWLQRFPISRIKLDRSFVARLSAGTTEHAIIRATIDLAHALGIRVVAEGIEDAAQRDLLTELGCDFGQGFVLARPMSAGALRDLIHQQPVRFALS